ncbi:MAG: hypothetical protein LBU47_05410 [Christensenellaceae bacterium]|jgi:hypothetical protein|nr:hypothetical protein [Christensenellaceae bacterium]
MEAKEQARKGRWFSVGYIAYQLVFPALLFLIERFFTPAPDWPIGLWFLAGIPLAGYGLLGLWFYADALLAARVPPQRRLLVRLLALILALWPAAASVGFSPIWPFGLQTNLSRLMGLQLGYLLFALLGECRLRGKRKSS